MNKCSGHFHLIGLFGRSLTNQISLHFNPPQVYKSSSLGRLKQFSRSFQREHIGFYRCLEKQQCIIRTDSERFWADMLTNFLPAFSANPRFSERDREWINIGARLLTVLSLRLQFEAAEVRCGSEAVRQSCDRRAYQHSK